MQTRPDSRSRASILLSLSHIDTNPHQIFDELISSLSTRSLPEACESILGRVFESPLSALWIYIPDHSQFYCSTRGRLAPTDRGLLGHVFHSRSILTANPQSSHPHFDPAWDSRLATSSDIVMFFPLLARDGSVQAVMQHARNGGVQRPFLEREVSLATHLSDKFQRYSRYLFSPAAQVALALDLVEFSTVPSVVRSLTQTLERFFRCRRAEIWMHSPRKSAFFRYDPASEAPFHFAAERAGTAGYCMARHASVNERSARLHAAYSEASDGYHDEPVLGQAFVDREGRSWAVALRGRAAPRCFRREDMIALRALLPFVVESMCASMSPPHFEDAIDEFKNKLAALVEMAENLTSVLDIDKLVPLIMERACALLSAQRCSLFLVDHNKHELVTRFHGGLDSVIRLPIGRGIVGQTATTGKIISIADAYQDERFDKSVDVRTGFRTRTLLCVPIFNNRGEIAGVTEMINKTDGAVFDEDDVKMLMAFNVFCGISLDNARLYDASLDLTRRLRTFVDLSAALNNADTIRNVLEEILKNVSQIVNAVRATLFLYDANDRSCTQLLNLGPRVVHGDLFAQETIASKNVRTFRGEQITALVHQTAQTPASQEYEEIMGLDVAGGDDTDDTAMKAVRGGRITTLIDRDAKVAEVAVTSELVISCMPLMSSDHTVLGIMELESASKVLTEDLKLLDCFAVFAAISIERSQLMDLANLGKAELELKQWISESERIQIAVLPQRLLVSDEGIWGANFDAQAWDGAGHIKVVFAIFQRFGFLEEYQITNEKLFRFVTEISDTYNQVPYHNWRHAVDVTQFITYQVLESGSDRVFRKLELLALIVASICHDANHDGFSNVYNIKAETPLGILFKNQSVMETHHCQVSIGIISKDECNIFSILDAKDNFYIWDTIIHIILATDMARHFELIKNFNQLLDRPQRETDDPEYRMGLLQMLMKCGDISNVARPFQLADKWCDVLCEEFFRQGDLEMAQGMEYTSPLNDREHLDKPKSQIGFYTFVCLPLFETVAKALPELETSVTQIRSNLESWKGGGDETKK